MRHRKAVESSVDPLCLATFGMNRTNLFLSRPALSTLSLFLTVVILLSGFERVHSQCERYAGTACSKYLRGSNTFRDSSLGDQIDIERAMVTFILSVNRGSAPGTCRDFIIEMLCHHAFPFCYPNDTSGVESQPVCLRDCLIAKNELCASHWSEIVEGSREYFQLYAKNRTQSFATSVDGTALTECYGFQSQNGGEEPECFTTTWKSQASYSDRHMSDYCFVGIGQGYSGLVSVTASGTTCQPWCSQWPHSHPFNCSLHPELEAAENSCRNPGGRSDGPWCYTTDAAVRWERCDVPKCEPSTMCQRSIPQIWGMCEQFGVGPDDAIFLNTSLVSSQEKLASSLLSVVNILEHLQVTSQCHTTIHPFFCHVAFPLCDWSTPEPRPRQICREYCTYTKTLSCQDVWSELGKEMLASQSVWPLRLPTCEDLPSQYDANPPDCIVRPFNSNLETTTFNTGCFTNVAADYVGNMSVTESGRTCQLWSSRYPHNHTDDLSTLSYEAQQNANSCRNPEGRRQKPWCYTTDPALPWEYCDIPECSDKTRDETMVIIAVVIGGILFLLLGCVITISCICHYKRAHGNCCNVGSGEALTDCDFLGEVLATKADCDTELRTMPSTEEADDSLNSTNPEQTQTNLDRDPPSDDVCDSVTEMVVKVQMHRNGSAVHSTD